MPYKFVKDVTDLRGLKDVLGIDFSPKKTCTFDCINCGLGRTNILTDKRDEFHPPNDVFNEIKSYIDEKSAPQHIMLTGSGEPTLYAGFGRLVEMIKGEFPDIKTMVFSNFSLLYREEVRKEVVLCDIVWGNFNTVIDEEFRKIYRPHKSVTIQDVMDGLKQFKAEYDGIFEAETRFLSGINDNEKNVDGLKEYMTDINPHKYHIFDAKYGGQSLSPEFVETLRKKFEDLPFPVAYNV
ncbi:MAG: radical SAM protein [candidate division WOR-3 bacterium]|nr:radical SAM protein [candidate division WOR-3 bacterium]